jgi:hypothetical protein
MRNACVAGSQPPTPPLELKRRQGTVALGDRRRTLPVASRMNPATWSVKLAGPLASVTLVSAAKKLSSRPASIPLTGHTDSVDMTCTVSPVVADTSSEPAALVSLVAFPEKYVTPPITAMDDTMSAKTAATRMSRRRACRFLLRTKDLISAALTEPEKSCGARERIWGERSRGAV